MAILKKRVGGFTLLDIKTSKATVIKCVWYWLKDGQKRSTHIRIRDLWQNDTKIQWEMDNAGLIW